MKLGTRGPQNFMTPVKTCTARTYAEVESWVRTTPDSRPTAFQKIGSTIWVATSKMQNLLREHTPGPTPRPKKQTRAVPGRRLWPGYATVQAVYSITSTRSAVNKVHPFSILASRETARDEKAISPRSSRHFCGGVRAVPEFESTSRYANTRSLQWSERCIIVTKSSAFQHRL